MVSVAGIIAYFFIYPQVQQVRTNQDLENRFSSELARVANVNQVLNQHQATIASIPLADRQKLSRFLPKDIDEIVLLKDVESLLNTFNISPDNISLGNSENQSSNSGNGSAVTPEQLEAELVSVGFEVDYQTLKSLLLFSETHPYILEFRELTLSPDETNGRVQVEAVMAVFMYSNEDEVSGVNN